MIQMAKGPLKEHNQQLREGVQEKRHLGINKGGQGLHWQGMCVAKSIPLH